MRNKIRERKEVQAQDYEKNFHSSSSFYSSSPVEQLSSSALFFKAPTLSLTLGRYNKVPHQTPFHKSRKSLPEYGLRGEEAEIREGCK